MDQITFALQEIKKDSGVSEENFALLEKIIKRHRKRMLRAFPNYDLFITGTGQSYGLKIQQKIIDSFSDLSKNTSSSDYDAKSDLGEKIEIKSIKATKGKSSDYIGARILNLSPKTKLNIGGSFQQVKPTECDWFIFHILYGDTERLFLVPSKMFSATPKRENRESGKILLSAQHRGHKTEGQANVGQILSRASYFEPSINYSSFTPNAFSFIKLRQEIEARLSQLGSGWALPED